MLKRFPLVLVMFLSLCTSLLAQDDAVLFTVADKAVTASEFKYIYSKTNGKKADYSKESVEEYLDLYTKFKLKVQKAREMKIDTIPVLKRELEGYQMQLANSYLIDKEVKERLLREAYERKKQDVNISHIMVRITGPQLPADTLRAYQKIKTAQEVIQKGSPFANAAKMYSEDTYSKNNGGNIGWVTAVLPNGFYEMESAAYNTQKGEVSNIIRTNMGYHLIQVNEKRPSRGTLEVAQIVVWEDKKDPSKNPKTIIEDVYKQLKDGADFEKLAREVSSDKKTAKKDGYLGFFGIGEYESSFEDAAFALKKDGDFSAPIQTSTGWHIIKRISRPNYGTYETEKNRLQSKIEKDLRFT
ncbi:MAG: peptidylprolyl isomerase, partial [Saprospiraceae bacterium]